MKRKKKVEEMIKEVRLIRMDDLSENRVKDKILDILEEIWKYIKKEKVKFT